MKLVLQLEPMDAQKVAALAAAQAGHPDVLERLRRNVEGPPPPVTRGALWNAQVMCLITTQNKSGQGSRVDLLLQSKALDIEKCPQPPGEVEAWAAGILEKSKLRRWKLVSKLLATNYERLTHDWTELEAWSDALTRQRLMGPIPSHSDLERQAARFLQKHLKGLGPKQSRNFWQSLGLTRYEVPVDSRVLRWCRKELELDLPSPALSDNKFYEMVVDALGALCQQVNVLPCLFDAAVFSLFERTVETE